MNKSIKQTIQLRNRICKEKGIKLLKVFDTNKHEPNKDVILGQWKNKKVVLRVGEHRPVDFYPAGYKGRHFVVPKLYFADKLKNYEIEEYLPGKLFCDLLKKPKYNKLFINEQWQKKLIQAHWEFQRVAKSFRLPVKYSKKKKILFFYKYAKKSIPKRYQKIIEKIIFGSSYDFFWKRFYPCKWKFAPDNLLAMPNDRIGFIDLAGVSRRIWGYDFFWLFWPQWYNFSLADYKKVKEHFDYLQQFYQMVYRYAPKAEKQGSKLFYLKCNLGLLERIIGSMYDLNHRIRHTLKMKARQKKEMMKFLNELLVLTLAKLEIQ